MIHKDLLSLLMVLETFVDRYDGAQIAKELGYKLEFENCLYSEDI